MPYRHSAQRISSLKLRVGLGLGLVLGSAGLVLASTLLFPATSNGRVSPINWGATESPGAPSKKLNFKPRLPVPFQYTPSSVSTEQAAYLLTDTCLYRGETERLPGPVRYRLTLRGPGPDQTYTPAAASTMSALQRSWGTIKVMFR